MLKRRGPIPGCDGNEPLTAAEAPPTIPPRMALNARLTRVLPSGGGSGSGGGSFSKPKGGRAYALPPHFAGTTESCNTSAMDPPRSCAW